MVASEVQRQVREIESVQCEACAVQRLRLGCKRVKLAAMGKGLGARGWVYCQKHRCAKHRPITKPTVRIIFEWKIRVSTLEYRQEQHLRIGQFVQRIVLVIQGIG